MCVLLCFVKGWIPDPELQLLRDLRIAAQINIISHLLSWGLPIIYIASRPEKKKKNQLWIGMYLTAGLANSGPSFRRPCYLNLAWSQLRCESSNNQVGDAAVDSWTPRFSNVWHIDQLNKPRNNHQRRVHILD